MAQQKNNLSGCQFLYLMEIQKHASFSLEFFPFNSNHWSIPSPLTFSFNRFLNL
ncbi:hypothetical protein D932_03102 [Enterococcus casseliflavus 14-MB-W-14]|nr:hypothetical protein D932_03102 [Enterococcus casseliflavus 14-MB-W-14]